MMDWWHIATVAVLMCVFTCEAIYAFYAQRARFEPVYAGRSEALLLADLPKRGWWEKPFTKFAQKRHPGGGKGIDAFTELEFIFDAKAVEATHIARGVARLTLAVFVIAGIAFGQFEVPWLADSSPPAPSS